MKSDQYAAYFTPEYLMGPNGMALLEEMIAPIEHAFSGARVLDLGCGQGLTSLYLAKETGAQQIFSAELWTPATRLEQNFVSWGIDDKAFPIHADANALPFADAFFDLIVSVDAYHYFGRETGFFAEKIWPLVKAGGRVCLCMPGLKREFDGGMPALMTEWAGDEAGFFHSGAWWRDVLLSGAEGVAEVIVRESGISERAWADWFASGHEYALRDKEYLDRGLDSVLNFVSIVLRKAG